MIRKILILLLFVILISLWQLNWFDSNKSWQISTGWNKIPKELQVNFYQPDNTQPKISWLGHAGFLIEWENERLAFDPNLSEFCKVSRRTFSAPIKSEALGELDAVIISHAHYDHLDIPTLEEIPRITRIVLPKLSQNFLPLTLTSKTQITDLNPQEQIQIGNLKITAVSAMHNGSRYHPFKSKYQALGYIITNGKSTLYYSGDTGYSNQFHEIAELYQPDIAILPIGAFRPEFILKDYHLSPKEAVQAAIDLKVDTVIPSHFGTFRLSFDYPSTALPLFASAASEENINWKMPQLAK